MFQDGTEKCIDSEIPFEIPSSWTGERLGNITNIARGGSPRPIESYITKHESGVDWIKIGDTEKMESTSLAPKKKLFQKGYQNQDMFTLAIFYSRIR